MMDAGSWTSSKPYGRAARPADAVETVLDTVSDRYALVMVEDGTGAVLRPAENTALFEGPDRLRIVQGGEQAVATFTHDLASLSVPVRGASRRRHRLRAWVAGGAGTAPAHERLGAVEEVHAWLAAVAPEDPEAVARRKGKTVAEPRRRIGLDD